jgi:hypothetical protein
VTDFPESISVIWSHALQTAPGFPAHDCRQAANKLLDTLAAALDDTPAPRFGAARLIGHLITHVAAIDDPPLTDRPKSNRVGLAEKLAMELWSATAIIRPKLTIEPKPKPKPAPQTKVGSSLERRQVESGRKEESQTAAEVEPRDVPADFLGGIVD